MAKKYDAIILGSGQAGSPMAGALAKEGKKVLLIEKGSLGGTCVNTGCTPSKTLHEAVRKIYHARHLDYAGFKIEREAFSFSKMMDHVRGLRDQFNKGLTQSLEQLEKLDIVFGHGHFIDSKTVEVSLKKGGTEIYEAQQIFINTGGRPRLPNIEGLDEINYYTSENIWEINDLPGHLLILGGGYIGLEFAQSFARLGSRVTVIHRGSQIIKREDDDIIESLREKLEDEGVEFITDKEPVKVNSAKKQVELDLTDGHVIKGDQLLIATGRQPNTDDIGLENTAITTNDKEHIKVNEHLQTAVEGIFAMGEVAGTPQFTHMAYDDFRIVNGILNGQTNHTNKDRVVPYTLFTDPQLGRFGLNEKQAKKEGVEYYLYELPMSSFARARERHETHGKAKVICDKKDGKILGASILGVEGGELMSTLLVAMKGNVSAKGLREMTFAHPLLAESLNNVFSQ